MGKDQFSQIVCDDGYGDDNGDDNSGGDGNDDDDGGGDDGGNDGGGTPVSVVALVFQESREAPRPVVGNWQLLALMNYNQFASPFPQTPRRRPSPTPHPTTTRWLPLW